MAYRSSKVSSRPDSIFEIHQLWQSGFSRVYSLYCCSCTFKPEIIKIGRSSHNMYSNNMLNFQVSTTILNACIKKSLETYWRDNSLRLVVDWLLLPVLFVFLLWLTFCVCVLRRFLTNFLKLIHSLFPRSSSWTYSSKKERIFLFPDTDNQKSWMQTHRLTMRLKDLHEGMLIKCLWGWSVLICHLHFIQSGLNQ